MFGSPFSRLVLLGTAAVGYLALTFPIFEALPFGTVPDAWAALWPTRRGAVLAWWHVLNACGALAAALPVSVLLRITLGRLTPRVGLIVATPAALFALSALVTYPAAVRMEPVGAVTSTAALAALLLAALPLSTAVLSAVAPGSPAEPGGRV